MNKPAETVLLREKGSKTSAPFGADHAKRLLAYPNTQWEEVADPKPEAGAAKSKPAPAAAASSSDTTGQPHAV
jgi:hypothetical protein